MATIRALDAAKVAEVAGRLGAEVAETVQRELLQWAKDGARDVGELEQWVRRVMGLVGQMLTQGCVELIRAEAEGVQECGCGARMYSEGIRSRTVVTVVGECELQRRYYRCRWCGAGTHPADDALGLDSGTGSPGVRGLLGLFAGLLPIRRAVQALELAGHVRMSASTCARVARELGEQAQGHEVRRRAPVLERDESLYVAIDGTSIWTQTGWREAKAAVFYQVKRGRGGREKEAARHPSYVAAMEGAEAFGERVYAEGQQRGVERRGLRGALGDGAPWIWNQVDMHFPGVVQIVDWYHAKERLKQVGQTVYGEKTARCERWVDERLDRLWRQGPEPVLRSLQRLRPKGKKARDVVRRAVGYFTTNAERMRYPQLRRRLQPVGSGPVETACKYLIGTRFKQPGMRWSRRGAKAILCLRTAFFNNCYEQLIEQLRPAA